MFGSNVLEVAIGLAFLYLLLALVCTTVNELIESVLKRRAKTLEQGLLELFGGNKTAATAWKSGATAAAGGPPPAGQKVADTAAWLRTLYEHPLICCLYNGDYQPGSRRLPSYVPARSFAIALLDSVKPAEPKPAEPKPATLAAADAGLPHPAAVRAAGLSGAAGTDAVPADASGAVPPAAAAGVASDDLIAALRKAVEEKAELPVPVKAALLVLIDSAGNDITRVRENVEKWFDSVMDRASGWYKRYVQYLTWGVGITLAVALNADTFAVANALSRDAVLRTSFTAAATEYAQAKEPNPPAAADGQNMKAKMDEVAKQVNQVQGFGLPLGWNEGDPRTRPAAEWGWVLKALGWLVTGAAISLGAPFWFDTLNKFIQFRGAVKPAKDEKQGKK